jgi:hypothetical protein
MVNGEWIGLVCSFAYDSNSLCCGNVDGDGYLAYSRLLANTSLEILSVDRSSTFHQFSGDL